MQTQVIPDLKAIAHDHAARIAAAKRRIIICSGTGCIANGAMRVYEALTEQIRAAGFDLTVELKDDRPASGIMLSNSGCHGFCQMGPLVTILPENWLYVKTRPEDAAEIVETTLRQNKPVERLLYRNTKDNTTCAGPSEIPFYRRQTRLALEQCGHIDPEDIREYIQIGGYEAARRACTSLDPKAICNEILAAGLRGRGGGGFPTGRKWDTARKQPGPHKYVICNGDEGDPGAFMDRSVLEGNPHAVIEGMIIAARAVGADAGCIYVRAEYPLAVGRLRRAVADATAMGLLGKNIFGSDLNFHIEVMEGAGAFVCGEETAMIASISGRRGMPVPKPPFPAVSGLNGLPTVINNVETLATVPLIMRMGADAFRRMGTPKSPGTKTFALTGHVANTGLIEVPFGTTLREIIFNIGGGVIDADGKPWPDGFKAVQIGGPSGGCLTSTHLDLPLDFDSLRTAGAMIGSGGLVVMNQSSCMVSVARFFMQFTQNESCGKCVLCREGTRQMLALLDDITEGRADEGTLPLLEELALAVQRGSLCGLGRTAPNPILSTLRHFRSEYEAHIKEKRCPAGQCRALRKPTIIAERCKSCGLCARKCPVKAITGAKGVPYVINPEVCINCGACADACKFKAIV